MKKRIYVVVMLLICARVLSFSGASSESRSVEIYFFHDTACASCNGEEKFDEIVSEVLVETEEEYPYTIQKENIFHSSGREVYEKITRKFGLDPSKLENPVCIINGKALQGFEEIRKGLKEAYLTAGEDIFLYHKAAPELESEEKELFGNFETNPEHITVLYFYRVTCEECIKAKEIIDDIPNQICVNGQWKQVDVIRMNTRSGRNGERIRNLFEAYTVPEKDQVVPIVFLTDMYLAGYDSISSELLPLLEKGAGSDFYLPDKILFRKG